MTPTAPATADLAFWEAYIEAHPDDWTAYAVAADEWEGVDVAVARAYRWMARNHKCPGELTWMDNGWRWFKIGVGPADGRPTENLPARVYSKLRGWRRGQMFSSMSKLYETRLDAVRALGLALQSLERRSQR